RAIRSSTSSVRVAIAALLTPRNLTVGAELRGQARNAIRAVDADPGQRQQAVPRRGRPEALDRRAEEPGRAHGGEDAPVVAAGRVAEEVDGNVEAPPDPRSRARDLVPEVGGAERRQVEMVDRVGVD